MDLKVSGGRGGRLRASPVGRCRLGEGLRGWQARSRPCSAPGGGGGNGARVVMLEKFTAPVFSGKHYHRHILVCSFASFIIVWRWLSAYGAVLRYFKRVVVCQGNIIHGGRGRENPESFWHKPSQILLNMKNIARAGFNMSSARPGGGGEGNMASGQDYHSGERGSGSPCQPACRGLFVHPVLPSLGANPRILQQADVTQHLQLSNLGFLLRIEKLDKTQRCHQTGRSEAWFGFVQEWFFPLL